MNQFNFSESERGNVSLSGEYMGVEKKLGLWGEDEKVVLQVSFAPQNYPTWDIRTADMTKEQLVKHINEKYGSLYAESAEDG